MLVLQERDSELPVSLDSIKAHLAIEHEEDDERLTELVNSAVALFERECNTDFVETTWQELLPTFPCRLARGPVATVDSLEYYDTTNTLQTVDEDSYYLLTPHMQQAKLVPKTTWPKTYNRPDAVIVEYTTSPGTSELFVQGVKLLVAHWNENREGQDIPAGFERVLGLLRKNYYK